MRRIKNIEYKKDYIAFRQVYIQFLELGEKLKIRSKNGKSKTPSKVCKYIIENYAKKSNLEIARHLHISVSYLGALLKMLHLTTLYLKEDEITFCNLYRLLCGNFSNSYTLGLLKKYNIPIYTDELNRVKLIKLSEFYEWYKNHIRLITLKSYEIGSLPNEPDWFIEKAKADKRAYEYTYKRYWTKEEDNKLKELVEKRKTYKECSTVLKRTGNSIKRRCYDLKIDKPKRTKCHYWTAEEMKALKELWLKGYEPCIIAEELDKVSQTENFVNLPQKNFINPKAKTAKNGRSDREVTSMLERFNYFDAPVEKFRIKGICKC